jgi:hypothetical protein
MVSAALIRACDSAMRSCRNDNERVKPPLYAVPLNELASIVFEGIDGRHSERSCSGSTLATPPKQADPEIELPLRKCLSDDRGFDRSRSVSSASFSPQPGLGTIASSQLTTSSLKSLDGTGRLSTRRRHFRRETDLNDKKRLHMKAKESAFNDC